MNKFTRYSIGIFISLIIFWVGIDLYSRSSGSGVSGLTATNSNGCSCHTSQSNTATTLSVTSSTGSFKFKPGQQVTFTVSVSHQSNPKAGVNIAVKTTETGSTNAGTLSFESGSGLRSENGELTHSSSKNMSDKKADFTFSWTAPNTPGTYYLRAIGNAVDGNGSANSGDHYNWLTPKELTVVGLDITSPIATTTWCTETNQNITWNSTGITQIKIELSSDGGTTFPITIANNVNANTGSYSWSIPNTLESGNNYKIKISDVSDASINTISSAFNISKAPVITSHPQSTTICEGTTLNLTISVNGAVSNYTWKKGNTVVSSGNNPNLVINNVSLNDAGEYTCVISSPCGNDITSRAATVVINEKVDIITQPSGTEICEGETLRIISRTKGYNKRVKWFFNNLELNNQTSDTLLINNANSSNSGQYYVSVSGDCGNTVNSNTIVVNVYPGANITKDLTNQNICEGDTIKLNVEIAGGGNKIYRWQKDNVNLTGQNNSSLIIPNAKTDDAGIYKCIIETQCSGIINSQEALITINSKPSITKQPQSITVFEGNIINLEVEAKNATSYQWRKNGQNLINKTSSKLTIQNALIEDSGNYDCIVKNNCGEILSELAKVTVQKNDGGAILSLNQNIINFDSIPMLQNKSMTFKDLIKNIGDVDLIISSSEFESSNEINFVDKNTYPIKLAPKESRDLTFDFTPKTKGQLSAKLNFKSNAKNNPTLELMGFSMLQSFNFNSNTLNFISNEVNKDVIETLKIESEGNVPIYIDNIQISGGDSSYFRLITNKFPIELLPLATANIEVAFNSNKDGIFNSFLLVKFRHLENNITFKLTGKAVITSVNNKNKNFVEIYPNPTDNLLNIITENEGEFEFEIINSIGLTLQSGKFEKGTIIYLNNSIYTNGLYLLRLKNNKEIYYYKIIKK